MSRTPFPRHRLSPLTLGTVQLGMAYGKVVASRPPSAVAAGDLLDAAWAAGITCLDTARAYGAAEARIGEWLSGREPAQRPLIVTKLPPLPSPPPADPASFVSRAFDASLRDLGVERVDGYILHRAGDIFTEGVAAALDALVATGRTAAIGVSGYDPATIDEALAAAPNLTLVQAPFGLLDRRLAAAGTLERCSERGVTMFARSLFLQGVVFVEPERLPDYLEPLKPGLARLRALAAEAGVGLAALAFAAVRREPAVASAVIGVADATQLRANAMAAATLVDASLLDRALAAVGGLPDSVLDPRRWPA